MYGSFYLLLVNVCLISFKFKCPLDYQVNYLQCDYLLIYIFLVIVFVSFVTNINKFIIYLFFQGKIGKGILEIVSNREMSILVFSPISYNIHKNNRFLIVGNFDDDGHNDCLVIVHFDLIEMFI